MLITRRGYAKRGICRRRVSVCVSVCVSATLRYCIKTAKRKITQITPHDSPMTLVFWCQKIMAKFERDHPLQGRQMQVGWIKIGHLRRKTRYNSKMVQDRYIVSIKVEKEVICALSNGDVSDNLGWPLTPQNTQIFATFVAFHIFVVS